MSTTSNQLDSLCAKAEQLGYDRARAEVSREQRRFEAAKAIAVGMIANSEAARIMREHGVAPDHARMGIVRDSVIVADLLLAELERTAGEKAP